MCGQERTAEQVGRMCAQGVMQMMKRDKPYESAQWKTSGDIMRPGGLELTGRLVELSCLPKGARVLDLGCGRGVSTAFLAEAGFKAVGMDQSASLLDEARNRRPNATFVHGDATAIPCSDGAFDAVLLECVLSAVPATAALAECARVTGPLGRVLLTDVYDRDGGEAQLSRAWWEWQLEAGGFRCICFEDHTRDLQNFAAQLLWDTGSLEGLCGCMNCEMPAKPGYFLMIAEKGVR